MDTPVAKLAKEATSNALSLAFGTKKAQVKKVPVQKTRMYSWRDMLKLQQNADTEKQQKNQDKEKSKWEREEAKETAQEENALKHRKQGCRGWHDSDKIAPVFNGGRTWLVCNQCEAFAVCPKCKSSCRSLMDEHKDECVEEE